MNNELKIMGGILTGSLILMIGMVFILSMQSNSPTLNTNEQVYNIDYSKGQKIGNDNAKIKLVEFSDFQCPACKAYEPYVQEVRSLYPEDMQFIYRHFPLTQHKNAEPAVHVAEYAATHGKFWEVHNKLFETQQKWGELNDPKDFFVNLGKELGLEEQGLKDALENKLASSKISEDVAEGKSLQVNATPTFYLNGRKLQLKNFLDLKNAVEQEIKK